MDDHDNTIQPEPLVERSSVESSAGSRNPAAFLLSAPDKLTAGAYEEMLKKNKVAVVLEYREPNPFSAFSNTGGTSGTGGANGVGDAGRIGSAGVGVGSSSTVTIGGGAPYNSSVQTASVNLYVPADQLARARELIDEYENQPITYKTPPPALNQKSRTSQALFAVILFFVFIVPIGASIYAIGSRIIKYFAR